MTKENKTQEIEEKLNIVIKQAYALGRLDEGAKIDEDIYPIIPRVTEVKELNSTIQQKQEEAVKEFVEFIYNALSEYQPQYFISGILEGLKSEFIEQFKQQKERI